MRRAPLIGSEGCQSGAPVLRPPVLQPGRQRRAGAVATRWLDRGEGAGERAGDAALLSRCCRPCRVAPAGPREPWCRGSRPRAAAYGPAAPDRLPPPRCPRRPCLAAAAAPPAGAKEAAAAAAAALHYARLVALHGVLVRRRVVRRRHAGAAATGLLGPRTAHAQPRGPQVAAAAAADLQGPAEPGSGHRRGRRGRRRRRGGPGLPQPHFQLPERRRHQAAAPGGDHRREEGRHPGAARVLAGPPGRAGGGRRAPLLRSQLRAGTNLVQPTEFLERGEIQHVSFKEKFLCPEALSTKGGLYTVPRLN